MKLSSLIICDGAGEIYTVLICIMILSVSNDGKFNKGMIFLLSAILMLLFIYIFWCKIGLFSC
jgi:hypothetical protein